LLFSHHTVTLRDVTASCCWIDAHQGYVSWCFMAGQRAAEERESVCGCVCVCVCVGNRGGRVKNLACLKCFHVNIQVCKLAEVSPIWRKHPK